MSLYNPRGKRTRDVYRAVSQSKDKTNFIKKGVSTLYKSRKGEPVPVSFPRLENPEARYAPRTRKAGFPLPGSGHSRGIPSVGAGEGEEGDEIGRYNSGSRGGLGSRKGDEPIYGTVDRESIIGYLKNDLKLDFIKPGKNLRFERYDFSIVAKHGPDSTFSLEHTVMESFKRQALWNEDNSFDPGSIEQEDMRYRLPKIRFKEDKDAVVVFKRDVSGSVSEEEMKMSYALTMLIEYWLEESYHKNVRSVYLPHNHMAWEDSKEGYYSLRPSGGTRFGEAYKIILLMLNGEDYQRKQGVTRKEIKSKETDLYIVDMSDGLDSNPNASLNVLEQVMPHVTRFCYLETNFGGYYSYYEDIRFSSYLLKSFPEGHRSGILRIAKTSSMEGIENALKIFFGKDYKPTS